MVTLFVQGPSEYYPDNFYGDEEFDDYERELRDYGHRQREREKERETVRRPESNRGRDRGELFQKIRDRKRAFTPLSDDEQPHVFKSNRSDDDDDDYSEKDIQSKIVMPGSKEKKLSNTEEPLHEVQDHTFMTSKQIRSILILPLSGIVLNLQTPTLLCLNKFTPSPQHIESK